MKINLKNNWMFLVLLLLGFLLALSFVVGCTSTKQIKAYNGAQLVNRHFQHHNFWESNNMEIIDELILRGGIPASARPEYEAGKWTHHRMDNPVTPWGKSAGIHFFDWEALGYATFKDWTESEYFGHGVGPDVVVYTGGRITTVRNLGAGHISVRTIGK